jgi:predicted RecA/RadA family phage recombinase
LPVLGTSTIYRGSAVGDSSGYSRPLVAGDSFRGFADAKVDNLTGASGAKNVDVITEGYAQVTLASVAITDVGKPVYMSDDETFTLTQGSNSLVGSVYRYVAANTCVIKFGDNKTLQASAVSTTAVTAVATTAASLAGYGFTTQAQADAIVASLNAVITKQASIVTALNAMLGGSKG